MGERACVSASEAASAGLARYPALRYSGTDRTPCKLAARAAYHPVSRFFFDEVIERSASVRTREPLGPVYALILNLLDLVDDGTHCGRSSIESSCGSSWRREAEAQSSSRVRSRLTSSERDGGCESLKGSQWTPYPLGCYASASAMTAEDARRCSSRAGRQITKTAITPE